MSAPFYTFIDYQCCSITEITCGRALGRWWRYAAHSLPFHSDGTKRRGERRCSPANIDAFSLQIWSDIACSSFRKELVNFIQEWILVAHPTNQPKSICEMFESLDGRSSCNISLQIGGRADKGVLAGNASERPLLQ